MTIALLGALVGVGLLLVGRAVRPPRPSLGAALAALDQRGPSVLDQPTGSGWQRATVSIGLRLASARPVPLRVVADLRVTGRAPEHLAVEQLVAGATGAGTPLAMTVLLTAAGLVPPTTTLLAASFVFGALGWITPRLLLRDRARARRAAFVHVLSGYLDLVTIVLAGGAGVETALHAAAEAGDGWAVAELRAALVRARSLRRSPWDEFADLGRELVVPELVELAASVRLAGEQGARIRSSLAARAASLRGHQLARVEAEAQSATERMALPTVLLFLGFLVFIGYPAVAQLLGGGL